MTITRVAMLTAGGYAPCLSSAVGGLIERYTELMPQVELVGYKHGYHGLLTGTKVVIDEAMVDNGTPAILIYADQPAGKVAS